MNRRSLVGYSPWGRKELDMTEQLSPFLKLGFFLCFQQAQELYFGKCRHFCPPP